jgi:predicted CXXCH cytochrome family protein
MKKILAALALAVATSASALAPAHDLTTQGGTNGSCQYCHAPHLWAAPDALSTSAPLWNRADVTVTNPYVTLGSGLTAPGPNSRTCLTCHDGATPLGAVRNAAIVGDLPLPLATKVTGLDLRDDHPVGVVYVSGGLYNVTTLPLYGATNTVECATCHEPHAVSLNGQFLRLARLNLCSNCHNK